jgi:hypothetical protein
MPIDVLGPTNATTIAVTEIHGLSYIKVRVWPASDGFNYIPCADIAALYETMVRSPKEVSGIGVKLVHESPGGK